MKLLNSLLQRQVVQLYSARSKQIDLEFAIKALKCHKDDQHKVKSIDTEVEVPPFACSFNKSLLKGHMLAVADEEGSVSLFDLRRQGPSSKLKGWVAHSNAIFDIAWVHGEPKLITASGDQTAQLWDIQHSTKLAIFRGHSSSLKSVDFQEDNLFVFSTGARDGNIMIWDVRCNKRDGYYQPVNTIRNCHSTLSSGTKKRGRRPSAVVSQGTQQSVTSVRFQGKDRIISAGAVDGNIKVWDLRKNYSTLRAEAVPCQVFPYPGSGSRKHGFSSLTLDSTKSKLFANCTNDIIYLYDCISFQKTPLSCFHGHTNATFYVKSVVSPDDQFLMSGSGDCDAYIWKIDEPNADPFHLSGHVGEVTSVAWCPQDQGKIVTCSDDNNFKVWRLNFDAKSDTEFVGQCERKPNTKIPSEKLDNPQSRVTTPNNSPTRSRGSSTSSSPVSLSPNSQTKSNSPQQFLQSWLKSNTNKRPRENDSTANKTKRYCINRVVQVENILDVNETIDKNSYPSTSMCEREISKICLNLGNSEMSLTQEQTIESEKENVQANGETETKFEQVHCKKGQHPSSEKANSIPEKKINAETNHVGTIVVQNGQKKNVEKDDKMPNWLCGIRSMKTRTNEQDCKKDKTLQQTISPLVTVSCSLDKEFAAVLKSMKCIKTYFKPLPESDEPSPSKYCER